MNSMILMPSWVGLVIALVIVVAIIVVTLILVPINVWFRALVSGAHVSTARLIGMKLRKVDYKKIVDIYIVSQKAGLNIPIVELETHMMAGGDIEKVIDALISAHSAKLDLDLELAKAIDLAGKDVVEAVKSSVVPRVVKTNWIEAIAKNGVQVKAIAQVTLKSKLEAQLGTADTDTILARVGEGIVTSIGKANTHSEILANPSIISKTIMADHLDKNTAYEILSIDICDVDVGANVGAKLKIEDAESKKKIAQAAAEERKAQAIALEQEMKAKTQEMEAIVLAAKSEEHKAMAQALKNGKFSAIDYYKLQNLTADTNMRNSISGKKEDKPKHGGDKPSGFGGINE